MKRYTITINKKQFKEFLGWVFAFCCFIGGCGYVFYLFLMNL